ncbi:hypothetical protein F5B19DRAFT_406695 [Rostrohypoxylon terebratum]|nr:hypothetical protein F5B19DRAFT_406695 [Rostrohypoxylon terebratum]
MYGPMMGGLREEEEEATVERIKTIFLFVLFSGRLLTLSELIHAVQIADDPNSSFKSSDTHFNDIPKAKRYYVTVCGGNFLEYNENTKMVQIIHQTARDFLLGDGWLLSQVRMSIQDAHIFISKTCLRYLSLFINRATERSPFTLKGTLETLSTPESLKNYAGYLNEKQLLPYIMGYFEYHRTQCRQNPAVEDATTKLSKSMTYHPAAYILHRLMPLSLVAYASSPCMGFIPELFYIAIINGFYTTIELVLMMTYNRIDYEKALVLAAEHGHGDILRLLVARLDINLSVISKVVREHEAFVKAFINRPGVGINDKIFEHGRSLLSLAAAEGNEAIVKLLINQPGIDVCS